MHSKVIMICCLSSVCRLSVTRVYCDKTTEVRITSSKHGGVYNELFLPTFTTIRHNANVKMDSLVA